MKSVLTYLKEKTKYLRTKNEIEDVVLFGSLMKGKDKPSDIDVLILFKDSINKDIEYEFRTLCGEVNNIEVTSKTIEGFRSEKFLPRDSVFFEGYSLFREEFLAETYGYASFGFFLYNTSDMSNSDRTRFYYALNGRKSNGFLKKTESFRISDNLVAVPLKHIAEAEEFFTYWKVEFKKLPILVPLRMAKEKLLTLNNITKNG